MLAPIVNKVRHAYPEATTDSINLMAMSYLIMATFVNPIASYITEKFGLRKAMVIGCGMMLLGVVM